MRQPKKKDERGIDAWRPDKNIGYNQACKDWEKWVEHCLGSLIKDQEKHLSIAYIEGVSEGLIYAKASLLGLGKMGRIRGEVEK